MASIVINPSVALFFTLVPSLNPGIHYPLYCVILSQFFAITSMMLWIKGEQKYPKDIEQGSSESNEQNTSYNAETL